MTSREAFGYSVRACLKLLPYVAALSLAGLAVGGIASGHPSAVVMACIGFIAVVRDITERKKADATLREQLRRDPLTGVLNHGAIVEELRELTRAGAASASAVLMIDADQLKAVNDTYGHGVGDAVLVVISEELSRDGAIVGRYAGDEFVCVLPGSDRDAAGRYRSAVLEALASRDVLDPETSSPVPVRASIGLAIWPDDASSLEELLQGSDSAMYSHKRSRLPEVISAAREPIGADRAAELVGRIVPLLTAQGSVNDKLKLVSQRLSMSVDYDGVDITMYAPRPEEPLAQNAFAQLPDEVIEAWKETEGDGDPQELHPVRALLQRTKRPLIIQDLWTDERLWESQRALLRTVGLRCGLVAPLIWGDDVIGAIAVASKRECAFSASDAQFLTTVASQVTAIIRMTTLFDQVTASAEELQQAREETVLLLAAAAEAHDHDTGRHLLGLRSLAALLAKELGFGDAEARELGVAAVLHDIGKLRVPETMLAKAVRLGDEEWELMKRHTGWGAEFLAGHQGFELATSIARSHHERWDGSGYPDGLTGKDVPEPAAIVAVADAFDAITTGRPYRKARSIVAAIEEMEAGSGTQFSPQVVDALVRLHARGELDSNDRHKLAA